ncbi:MAG: NUDIX domain-containing protein [Polyangiaceae bacterium]|nr:NUDIX domain-containing protein [Polyangiaceae bacterium]
MRVVDKAFAYVTDGPRLLVFRHRDFPDAGLQVPAGTVQPGETPVDAVLREVREEAGLEAFLGARALGVVEFDARTIGKTELHRRQFFHLPIAGKPADSWRHYERHATESESAEALAFDFYWLPFVEAQALLCGDHGCLIDTLKSCPDRS